MNDLRSCPFCGQEMMIGYSSAKHAFLFWHKDNPQKCAFYRFEIMDKDAYCLEDAIEKWNRRAEGIVI